MDSTEIMDAHITSVCKAASLVLWRIGKIKKLLDQSVAEKLVHAFVTSRLDYCNSLLHGSYSYQFRKLPHLQNAADRMVIRKKFECHSDIFSILRQLHWLPIEATVQLNVICIIFKIIHSQSAPAYLREFVSVNTGVGSFGWYHTESSATSPVTD